MTETNLTRAELDVIAERRAHVIREGWTPAHDDEHRDGEMAAAAAAYARHAASPDIYRRARRKARLVPDSWPWSADWWKPTTRRGDLVKAGALILAEIERLDRLAAPPALPAPHVPKQEPPAGIDDAMAHACRLAGFTRGPLPGVDYAKIDARLSGRRLAFRLRVRAAVALLLTTGGLNRLDLIQLGEISVPQASADLAEIAALFPGLMTYDKSARRYVPGPEADAWRAQSVAQSVADPEPDPFFAVKSPVIR